MEYIGSERGSERWISLLQWRQDYLVCYFGFWSLNKTRDTCLQKFHLKQHKSNVPIPWEKSVTVNFWPLPLNPVTRRVTCPTNKKNIKRNGYQDRGKPLKSVSIYYSKRTGPKEWMSHQLVSFVDTFDSTNLNVVNS